jgi:osmotically-inducible protein OsmY
MTILSLQTNLDAETIGAAAERRLRESPYYFLRALRCRVDGGVVTLIGRVPYGQLRQFAEAIVLRVEGVRAVVNRVEVYDPQRASA